MKVAMKPVSLLMEERQAEVRELFSLAEKYVDQANGWVLAESSRAVYFEPWRGAADAKLPREFASIIIFGPEAEARMEKQLDSQEGCLRIMRNDPAGAEFLARGMAAVLRDKQGCKLCYEEYFKEDESGFLVKVCGRLCGVEGRQ